MHRRRYGCGRLVRGGPLIAPDFEIRTARREELTLLPPLLLSAAWRYRNAGLTKVAELVESRVTPLSVLEAVQDAGLLYVAASHEGELIGFLAASTRDDFVHVMEIQVVPEHGRAGAGGLLLEAIANRAAQAGAPGVTLGCFRSVPWQRPFYAKHGFMEYLPADWTSDHRRTWEAQEKSGLDMADRMFQIRHVSPGYTIRPALASDLRAMPNIEFEAGQRFAAAGMPDISAMTREDLFPQDLARKLAAQGSLWIAAHDERPVGFAAMEATDGYGFLYEIDVLPAHAGNKLGWSLVMAAEAWARTHGLRGLTLATFRDIPWNRPYYERMGFVEWPRGELTPGHERSWRAQSRTLDMTKRLFMIKPFGGQMGA